MKAPNSNVIAAAAEKTRPEAVKPEEIEQAFQDVLQYEQGGTRKALTVLETHINQTYGDAAARKQTVGRLLGLLENSAASHGCKDFVCKKLMLLGGSEAVPALAKLKGHRTSSSGQAMMEAAGTCMELIDSENLTHRRSQ